MPVQTGSIPVQSYLDGPRVVVDSFLNDPLLIQALIFGMLDQEFLTDAILRQAGPVNSGAVEFWTSTPFYSDSDATKRAEFAEVHVAATSLGTPAVTFVDERALAILISDEMKRRMRIDPVNVQLQQVKNTLIKAWDDAFIAAIQAGVTQVVTGSDWTVNDPATVNSIRRDIVAAMKLVATAKAPGQNTAFGFKADTMVIGNGAQFDLIRQDDFNKPYLGNIASENLLYTGKLPSKILGLDVLVSRQIPDTMVIVLQRMAVGFIADELPLQATALYRDEPRKTWRADVQRASAVGLDQPLAAAVINLAGA